MKTENTSIRLKKLMYQRGLKQVDILNLAKPFCERYGIKLNKNDLSQYVSGKVEPGSNKLTILGLALGVSEAWLMGYDVPMSRGSSPTDANINRYPSPNETSDYVTFPVIGEIAAGYDSIALEDWEGEVVDIPASYLKGRDISEFFVLKVKGDSMYPLYQENDKVLILKQSTLNYSGQVGAILYDGEYATLKKVEFVYGEDWMKLIPINPNHPPKTITDSDLERCKVMGIPKLLIREIDS